MAPQDPVPRYNLGEVLFKRWQQAPPTGATRAQLQQEASAAYGAVEVLQADYRNVRQRLQQLAAATP